MTHADEDFWRKRAAKLDAWKQSETNEAAQRYAGIIGDQANCTRTEREALEEALANYEHTYGPHISVRMQFIRDAARKHLDTLPKPEPKFRVVASIAKSTGRITSRADYTRTAAVDLASKWMAHGCYDSVAVEQVSA